MHRRHLHPAQPGRLRQCPPGRHRQHGNSHARRASLLHRGIHRRVRPQRPADPPGRDRRLRHPGYILAEPPHLVHQPHPGRLLLPAGNGPVLLYALAQLRRHSRRPRSLEPACRQHLPEGRHHNVHQRGRLHHLRRATRQRVAASHHHRRPSRRQHRIPPFHRRERPHGDHPRRANIKRAHRHHPPGRRSH